MAKYAHSGALPQKAFKELKESEARKVKRDRARAEMGAWLSDYLDDAGYDLWEVAPYLFKAMMMNAFPPIDALDEKMNDTTDTAELRTGMLAFMRVLDLHMKTAETTATHDFTNAAAMGKVHTA